MYILLFKDIRRSDNILLKKRVKHGKAKRTPKVANEMLNRYELAKENTLDNLKKGRPSFHNGYEGELYEKNTFESKTLVGNTIVETHKGRLVPTYTKHRATYKLPMDATLNDILNAAYKLASPKDEVIYNKQGVPEQKKYTKGSKVLNVKIAIVNNDDFQLGNTLISTKTKGNINIHEVTVSRVACDLQTKKIHRLFSRSTMEQYKKLKSSINYFIDSQALINGVKEI